MNGTLNKVMLIGHLGDEIKMHYFDGGSCVARFQLATHDIFTNKVTNEKKITTEWHSIVVRNKLAEVCEKYLSKGDKIYVEGKIKSNQWQTSEGLTKTAIEIYAIEINFLSAKKNVENNPSGPAQELTKKTNFESENKELPINDLPF